MKTGKIVAIALVATLVIGFGVIVSQNATLSAPKSLGFQSATVSGFKFDAGRFSANSFITITLADGHDGDVPVDGGFNAPQIGQKVCVHSATGWFTDTQTHRFARPSKCSG